MLIHNVRYDNRQTDELLESIEQTDPDLILLVEPTQWWEEQLSPRLSDYSHTVFQLQENHYGILLYSRLELVNPRVRFLVDDEVPSIHTGVRMPAGGIMTLYGLHPKPPGLKREADTDREDSDQRDAELLIVAKEVVERVKQGGDEPFIVAGGFNDVTWSHTTRLFQRISGLLDPRVGRGLFNTYHAQSRILRFPLDHVFTSDHFRLVSLEVLPPLGSRTTTPSSWPLRSSPRPAPPRKGPWKRGEMGRRPKQSSTTHRRPWSLESRSRFQGCRPWPAACRRWRAKVPDAIRCAHRILPTDL